MKTNFKTIISGCALGVGILFISSLSAFASPGGLNIGNDTTICSGKSITLNSNITSSDAIYLWSTGDTTASVTLTPSATEIVTVAVSTNSGTYTSSVTITVDENCVWSGDANDDGHVSCRDVLKIGLAYGAKGAARANASSTWAPQHADNWNGKYKSGLNYKYADCNGDGVVDAKDLVAIHNNWSYTHNKTSEITDDGNPDLYMVPSEDSINPGDTLILHIYLGTVTNPVSGVYGVSFGHQFSPNSVVPGSMNLNVNSTNCWFYSASGGDIMPFLEEDDVNEVANVAISCTSGASVSGYGQIGDLSVICPDNIGGKRSVLEPITISLTDVEAISNDETNIPLSATPITIYYKNAANTGIKTSNAINAVVDVYPNPSNGNNLYVNVKGTNASKIEIIDLVGREVYTSIKSFSGESQLELPNLKQGMYFVRVSTNQGMVTKKINIIN